MHIVHKHCISISITCVIIAINHACGRTIRPIFPTSLTRRAVVRATSLPRDSWKVRGEWSTRRKI